MFQLPSGLGNGGLLTFASQSNNATDTAGSDTTIGQSYKAGFDVALQLISVSIGLTVGLLARYGRNVSWNPRVSDLFIAYFSSIHLEEGKDAQGGSSASRHPSY